MRTYPINHELYLHMGVAEAPLCNVLTNVDQSLTKVYKMRLLITKGGNKIWKTNQAKLK